MTELTWMNLDSELSMSPNSNCGPHPHDTPAGSADWSAFYVDLRKFVARSLGTRQDTDDVVQDIYRELLCSRRNEIKNPRAWIWKIAWRVLNDALRRRQRHRRRFIASEPAAIEALRSHGPLSAPPSDSILEAQEELLAALDGLPIATQIAIVRSRCYGWSYEQIALELGVSTAMVKKHMVRAIAHFDAYRFRQNLHEHG